MSKSRRNEPLTRYYFVDEAGDGNIFDKRGNVIVGNDGCSRFFMLGLLDLPNVDLVTTELNDLRKQLINDPYFKNVPSFDPRKNRTAIAFHAKDDPPEVRREVFRVLRKYTDCRFFAAIIDKREYVQYVRSQNSIDPNYRYHPNQLYDSLASRLTFNKLHKSNEYHICFATRGNSNRTTALRNALITAQTDFCIQHNILPVPTLNVTASQSRTMIALQATDYFLWALQRLYEMKEERYIEYLWSTFREVIDLNDPRVPNGVRHYTQKKPLTLAAIQDRIS